jgi:hypothetical protein
VAGSIAFAAVTYHLVERPIRYGEFSSAKIAFLSGAAGLSAIGAIMALLTSGFEGRFDPVAANIAPFKGPDLNQLYLKGTCFLEPEQNSASYPLEKCFPDKRPVALLWGDSHAAHFYDGLKVALERSGYSLAMLTSSACPPLIDYQVQTRPFCKEINDYVLSLIGSRKPDIVILSALWKPFVMDSLAKTLRLVTQNQVAAVVLGNTPVFEESPPLFLARQQRGEIKVSDRSAAEKALKELLISKRIEGAEFISLQDITCPNRRCALTDRSGALYYLDEGHLTSEGSRWIANRIISEILSSRPPG